MSGKPDTEGKPTERERTTVDADESDHPAGGLTSVVVKYRNGPDIRTIYPPCATDIERMSTWISANTAAFVHLENAR